MMNLVSAFFRLIRWKNLLFIVITQLLFYYCIYLPIFPGSGSASTLAWLITASVCIAAAGYIINDYFDLNIDLINKPHQNVINRIIGRRWAIVWHLVLSGFGILATAFALGLSRWYLILANLIVVLLLWFYSTSLKKQFLIGNIVISLLTAWTILIIFFAKVPVESAFGTEDSRITKFFRLSFLYAAFAFIITLIREAIKDVEDMEGDRRYGCTTLPIVAGLFTTRIYITIWIVVLVAALILLLLYVLQFGWWWAAAYSFLFVIAPLLVLFRRQLHASTPEDFGRLSRLTKGIMLAGILSMLFFRIYS